MLPRNAISSNFERPAQRDLAAEGPGRISQRLVYIKENPVWLVVSTPLKNISQLGLLFPMDENIKNVLNHQPAVGVSLKLSH